MQECSICCNSITREYKTKCNHKFDLQCIKIWINSDASNNNLCPICRSALDKDIKILSYMNKLDGLFTHKLNHD